MRLLELAGVEIDEAQARKGIEMPWIGAQDVMIKAGSLRELAGLKGVLRILQQGIGHVPECVSERPGPPAIYGPFKQP